MLAPVSRILKKTTSRISSNLIVDESSIQGFGRSHQDNTDSTMTLMNPACPQRKQIKKRNRKLSVNNRYNHRTVKMSGRDQFKIPYLYAGISPDVEEWLRLAGLPLAPFSMTTLTPEQGMDDNLRILFYDSRNHLSRADANLAEQIGYVTINLATLLYEYDPKEIDESMDLEPISDASIERQKRETVRFLLRLKRKIENVGGLWIRLSDFPFPYQSVVVVESADQLLNQNLPKIFECFESYSDSANWSDQDGSHSITGWYAQQYSSKTPVLLSQRQAADSIKSIIEEFPLTWITSIESFMMWWEFRSQVKLVIEASKREYHVDASARQNLFGSFHPSIEIWREEHVANFELKSGGMSVRENQLVFVNCGQSRNPAGFAPVNMTRPSQWKNIENYSAQTA